MVIRVVDACRLDDESDSEPPLAHQTSLILSDTRWLRIAGPTAIDRDREPAGKGWAVSVLPSGRGADVEFRSASPSSSSTTSVGQTVVALRGPRSSRPGPIVMTIARGVGYRLACARVRARGRHRRSGRGPPRPGPAVVARVEGVGWVPGRTDPTSRGSRGTADGYTLLADVSDGCQITDFLRSGDRARSSEGRHRGCRSGHAGAAQWKYRRLSKKREM